MKNSTTINYFTKDEFPGYDKSRALVLSHIEKHGAVKILEIGSGANPTLTQYDVMSLGLDYTTNDIDERELEKAPACFNRLHRDFCKNFETIDLHEKYDFIFSKMVNEHVENGGLYYSNIYKLLKPGGTTIHLFSTLYAFPFVVNRIAPEFVSDFLLDYFNPRQNKETHGKFKAYYSWSRGPTRNAIDKLTDAGFNVEEYNGYFGHSYYANRIKWLSWLEDVKSVFLAKYLSIPHLTAYAMIRMSK